MRVVKMQNNPAKLMCFVLCINCHSSPPPAPVACGQQNNKIYEQKRQKQQKHNAKKADSEHRSERIETEKKKQQTNKTIKMIYK